MGLGIGPADSATEWPLDQGCVCKSWQRRSVHQLPADSIMRLSHWNGVGTAVDAQPCNSLGCAKLVRQTFGNATFARDQYARATSVSMRPPMLRIAAPGRLLALGGGALCGERPGANRTSGAMVRQCATVERFPPNGCDLDRVFGPPVLVCPIPLPHSEVAITALLREPYKTPMSMLMARSRALYATQRAQIADRYC